MEESRVEEEEEKTQIEEIRNAKSKRRKRVGTKREKGNALVIKTERSKYSDVLKAMPS